MPQHKSTPRCSDWLTPERKSYGNPGEDAMTVVISPLLPEAALEVRKFTYRELLAMARRHYLVAWGHTRSP